jgi:hypothetical protein
VVAVPSRRLSRRGHDFSSQWCSLKSTPLAGSRPTLLGRPVQRGRRFTRARDLAFELAGERSSVPEQRSCIPAWNCSQQQAGSRYQRVCSLVGVSWVSSDAPRTSCVACPAHQLVIRGSCQCRIILLTCAALALDLCCAQTLHELHTRNLMATIGWSTAALDYRTCITRVGSLQLGCFPQDAKNRDFRHFIVALSDELAAPDLLQLAARCPDSRASCSGGFAGCGNGACESAGIGIFLLSAAPIVNGRKCEKCCKEVLGAFECVFMHH